MERLGHIFYRHLIDDFSEGDHQEYLESGLCDVCLIGGAALVFLGVFILSLL